MTPASMQCSPSREFQKMQRLCCCAWRRCGRRLLYAVLIEHGSSASHMTTAKVLVVISRLTECAGQACDAVSAYTNVKMEDAPKLLEQPETEYPIILDSQTSIPPPKMVGQNSSNGRILQGERLMEPRRS